MSTGSFAVSSRFMSFQREWAGELVLCVRFTR